MRSVEERIGWKGTVDIRRRFWFAVGDIVGVGIESCIGGGGEFEDG